MRRAMTVIGGAIGLILAIQMGVYAGYVDNGNGTVTDTSTGLMWQKETADNTKTWEEALSYCENLTLGGYSDWRLPTIKELRSLVDYSRYYPAIDTTFFPDTVASYYWSSTTYAGYPSGAWFVYFGYGNDDYDGKRSYNYVRAVRGGQGGGFADFSAAPTAGPAPLTVQFTDRSTNNPVAWNWSFGDGQGSNQQNPSHTYTAEGTYTVSLTVTDLDGDQDTETKTGFITVTGGHDCMAQHVLKSTGDAKAEKKADVLRRFRDEVLANTPDGREMIGLYYRHDEAIRRILMADPDLTKDCLKVMGKAWSAVYGALDTRKEIRIPENLRHEALQILDRVAENGSSALKADLQRVKAFLNDCPK